MTPEQVNDSESARVLSADGVFAREFAGFNPRQAQQEMAAHVEWAIREKKALVAESGTGTGKTFAYLVPVLLSGGRVILSTGTRHLQDQLFLRDLPAVREILGAPGKVERLKGRSNYLCLHRLEQSVDALFESAADVRDLDRVRGWSKRTDTGDRSELPNVADDARVWSSVTTSADNCLGSRCDHVQECFVYKARRRAMNADVVVVNHHLFFSDIALKDEGFGEVLPEYDCVVFDEAHLIPEIASQYFGFGFGSAGVRNLCRDVLVAEAADKSGVALEKPVRALEHAVDELVLSVGADRRGEFVELREEPGFVAAREHLEECLRGVEAALDSASVAGEDLALVHARCTSMVSALAQFDSNADGNLVLWYESGRRYLRLQATPISVATFLERRWQSDSVSLVFTSATLCAEGTGSHFRRAVGLDEAEVRIWNSPYDYHERGLLYVPENVPEPADPGFSGAMADRIRPVLAASRGRAFVLFTSFRVMREVYDLLSSDATFPLMLQGEAPKQQLVDRFRETPGGVLFGTTSFWEGVDVKGDALVCVIIDKLPFSSPFDPVNRARLRYIDEQGGDSFNEYLLPRAVLALKQGAGRLIRDEADYGVLMICDKRIVSRGYGRIFLDALPPMRRTRREELVVRFFDYFGGRGADK